jgi:eukaryotic-like serine/threonine-protein kinase
MSFTIGELVGQYRILEKLGEGGMATVYRAYEESLDRFVAIKVLHFSLSDNPGLLLRFRQEAQVIAKLEHPNIVPIYHFDEKDGQPYLVLKYIDGQSLRERLKRGSLPEIDILKLASAVEAALQQAHQYKILHRDIKPSNILLDKEERIYLTDFGLAKLISDEPSITTDAKPLGTPHYISPEQAAGIKILTEGTDIYSFGVVLYELCVGKVPFDGDTLTLIHNHIFDPLPLPTSIKPDLSVEVEKVLLKALAKNPNERYPTVKDLVDDFKKAWIDDGESTPLPLAQKRFTGFPYLKFENENSFFIRPGAMLVGRNSLANGMSVDVDLSKLDVNKRASRRHAVIQFKNGNVQVTDLGSRNGTIVNGERIRTPHKLREGDILQLGEGGVKLIFHSS